MNIKLLALTYLAHTEENMLTRIRLFILALCQNPTRAIRRKRFKFNNETTVFERSVIITLATNPGNPESKMLELGFPRVDWKRFHSISKNVFIREEVERYKRAHA